MNPNPTFHAEPLPQSGPRRGRTPGEVLREVFGIEAFRGIQPEAIAAVMAGRDILALMPTGGGKSMCYQVPALCLEGTALVVSPLQALMRDQADALRRLGVRAAALVAGEAMGHRERLEVESALASGSLDILFVSPERLASPRLASLLSGVRVSLVAVDEAHCVCEWGHDFRPDYRRIPEALAPLPRVPRIALTASASMAVREDIRDSLLAPASEILVGGFDRPNIALSVVERTDLFGQLATLLRERLPLGDALVYCPSRAQVEDLARRLSEHGFAAEGYHAGLPADRRRQVESEFRSGATRVVVATSAFGMGIDKPDIATVAHVALPASIEAYYQEIGRSGRDGRPALAWMAFSRSDIGKRSRPSPEGEEDAEAARRERARIETVLGYVETPQCRRNALLVRFGETFPSGCGRCDLCLAPKPAGDASGPVRQVLGMVEVIGGFSGVSVVAEALAGMATDRVVAAGANDPSLPFGALSRDGVDKARRLVRQCIGLGFLEVDDRSASVRLTDAGIDTLYSGAPVMLPGFEGPRLARRAASGQGLPEWRVELWKALHAARHEEALRRGVADRLVVTDKAMAAIVATGTVPDTVDGPLADAMRAAVEAVTPARASVPEAIDTGLF